MKTRLGNGCLFEVVDSECNDEQLVVRDIGHATCKPITNDADNLVAYLHRQGMLRIGNGIEKFLFYYDSEGQLDEIRHDSQGGFLGFSPGPCRSEWMKQTINPNLAE